MTTKAELVLLATIAPALFMRDYPTTCPNCGQTFETLDSVVSHQDECENGTEADR